MLGFLKMIWQPFANNMAAVMFWGGLIILLLGSFFGKTIESWTYVPIGTGDFALKTGGAILGAGVFSIIMKSSQFTDLFQKHIYDVFYNPENVHTGDGLLVKWRIMTKAILKDVLPEAHRDAANIIEQNFFRAELSYHFENHRINYDISVNSEQYATIKQITKTTILLTPGENSHVLDQKMRIGGTCAIKLLLLNNIEIDLADIVTEIEPGWHQITIPLDAHARTRSSGDKYVEMERVFEWEQNLKLDPCIMCLIGRYTKGFEVGAKVTNGYKINFDKFGLSDVFQSDQPQIEVDGQGYKRWLLATHDDLLLPGQGFILVVTPLTN
jgi:hypothetical protein